MAEELLISKTEDKEERYKELLPQISALVEGEEDLIANLSNISAAIKQTFDHLWVGFYLVKGEELVLGPFQGPIACTRISKGRGVCGTSWESGETIIVPDVDQFPGHIACSSESKSEIVIPVKDGEGKVYLVMDVDSVNLESFDDIDKNYLEQICTLI